MATPDAVKSNCYAWAFIQHRRLDRKWRAAGSPPGKEPALRFRRTRLLPVPVLHAQVQHWQDGVQVIEQFVPVNKSPLRWWQLWRAVWYSGEVIRGDMPQEK